MSIVINDVSPRVHYVATGGQTVFQVPFAWIENEHLKVYVNEELCTFAAPPGTDLQYSTTGEGTTNGGTITFGPPGCMVNDQVVIFRDMPIARTTDLPTSGVFPVAALNDDFDATTAMIQQTEVNVEKRTIRMMKEDFQEYWNALPNKEGRRGRLLGFDNNGQPILVPPSAFALLGGGGGGSGGGGASFLGTIWTDDAQPPTPWLDGQLWWQSSTGHLFCYYQDNDSGQWVQINFTTGTVAQGPVAGGPSGRIITTRLFSSGTWIKPSGCRYYRLRGVGGGGGGGGSNSALNLYAAGSGGGSGAYGETDWMDASGIVSATYTIGAGGPGSVGAASAGPGGTTTWNDGVVGATWYGGIAGYPHPGSPGTYIRPGGKPGTVAGPFLMVAGGYGGEGYSSNTNLLGGYGGGSPLGLGGEGVYGLAGSVNGNAPIQGWGGGGGGSIRGSTASQGEATGGRGGNGAIFVEEMY